jgi:hypothetical protein
LKVKIKNAKAKLTLRWGYDTAIGGDDGDGTVKVSDISMSMKLTPSLAHSNGINIDLDDLSVDIGDLDIDLDGTPIEAVTDWIIDEINDDLVDELEDQLHDAIKDAIKTANKALDDLPYPLEIPEIPINMIYNFTEILFVKDLLVSGGSMGIFEYRDDPDPNPPIPAIKNMKYFNSTGNPLQAFISDHTINTLLYSFYSANKLNLAFTNEWIYQETGVNVTTKDLEVLLPDIMKYGDKPIDIAVSTRSPIIFSSEDSGNFDLNTTILIEVEGVGPVMEFGTTGRAKWRIDVPDWTLTVALLNVTISNITEISSSIGDIPQDVLDALVDLGNLAV